MALAAPRQAAIPERCARGPVVLPRRRSGAFGSACPTAAGDSDGAAQQGGRSRRIPAPGARSALDASQHIAARDVAQRAFAPAPFGHLSGHHLPRLSRAACLELLSPSSWASSAFSSDWPRCPKAPRAACGSSRSPTPARRSASSPTGTTLRPRSTSACCLRRHGPWRPPLRPQRDRRSSSRCRLLALVAGFTALVILVAGQAATARSRAGLGLTIAALLGAVALAFRDRRNASGVTPTRLLLAATALAVVFAAQFALDRVLERFAEDPLKDSRVTLARTTAEAAQLYMPFGSGMGTSVPVYAMRQAPEDAVVDAYANRAHNDFLELWLEAGVGGAGTRGHIRALVDPQRPEAVAWRCRRRQRDRPDHGACGDPSGVPDHGSFLRRLSAAHGCHDGHPGIRLRSPGCATVGSERRFPQGSCPRGTRQARHRSTAKNPAASAACTAPCRCAYFATPNRAMGPRY